MLDDLAASLRATIARPGDVVDGAPGADRVGLYLATGLAYDAAGQVAAGLFMRALGSRSFYSAATVDNAPVLVAAELVTGNPMLNPVWNPDQPGLLLLVGTNPVVSHGYGTTLPDPVSRLRDFRRAGSRIWVLDPRRTESAALADEHLAVRPGSDVMVLAALARELMADDIDPTELCTPDDIAVLRRALEPFTIERAADAADVSVDSLRKLSNEIIVNRGRLAMFCGTGTTMALDGVVTEWLRWVLLVLSGSLDREGGMRFNRGVVNRHRAPVSDPMPAAPGPRSRPDLPRVAGQVPAIAMVDEIEAGNLRTLIVTGGNPLTALPEPDRVRAALQQLDALVVLDVMDGELCRLATHVLPASGQLERADMTLAEHVAIRSGTQSTHAVVPAVADRRSVWWMLTSLSAEMGLTLMPGIDPGTATDEQFLGALLAHSPLTAEAVFEAGPRGIDTPVEFGWVRETMLPGGHWQIAPRVMLDRLAAHQSQIGTRSLVMTPRREMGWSNSVRFAKQGDGPILRLHVDDARSAGVADGHQVEVASDHGTITATVAIDENIRAGVVSLTHGHEGQSPGRLTSSRVGVDPLTTMPHASGLPVTITPA
jgi:anaerobic selenocysteine-containing dehydrogenase